MSGVVRGIKKVFKKVGQVIKAVWKPLAIAAAVYFTAGAALSYFGAAGAAGGAGAFAGATATGTAGVAGAAATGAAAAGANLAAVGIGGMGAITGTAATAATTATAGLAGLGGTVGTWASAAPGIFSRTALQMATGKGSVNSVATAATNPASSAFSGASASGSSGASAGGLMNSVGNTVGAMSGYERAMYVQTLVSGVSGLLAPKPPSADQTARANARFRGSYFGVDEKDNQTFDPVASYNEFFQPRPGESYRGAMPDRPAAAAEPTSTAATVAAANQQRPALGRGGQNQNQRNNKAGPVSFIEEETNASGNAGYYSPDDQYSYG